MKTILWHLCYILLINKIACSHFRGGTMSLKYNDELNQIEIALQTFWRSGNSFCGESWISCINTCNYVSQNCTNRDFSTSQDWISGEKELVYRDIVFDGEFSSCCWVGDIGAGSWGLRIKSNFTDNSSPITTMLPIIRMQYGCGRTISIPVEDSDGDEVRCRWAKYEQRECGDYCQQIPGSINNCTLDIGTTGIGKYGIAIQIEDFDSWSSTFPLSSIPLQFILDVYSSTSPCSDLPIIVGTMPDNSIIYILPNVMWSYTITAQSSNGSSITEIITVSPKGMTKSPILSGSSLRKRYTTLNWNPDYSQYGANILCYAAVDNLGRMSEKNCLVLVVGHASGINCSLVICEHSCITGRGCICRPGYNLLADWSSCLASPNITSLKAISSTALQASWISPSVGHFNVSVLGYEASCTYAYGNNQYMYHNLSIVTTVNFTGLLPFTFYTCCIRAVSNMGNGASACGPIVQTLESIPRDAPNYVRVQTNGAASVNISWGPPFLPDGAIISYQLYINYFNGSTEMRKLGIATYYVLSNLMPNQWIGIELSASTKVGEGPRSLMVRERTDCIDGFYYNSDSSQCTAQCRCGSFPNRNYYNFTSGNTYAACENVTLQVVSLSTDYQIPIMNATAGAIIGTVMTRGSISVSSYANLLYYDYYSYYFLYFLEVLGDEYGRYILYRTPTLMIEPRYWYGITNTSSVCYDNSVPVISTPLTVHISSVIYTPGPMPFNLYVMSYNPYNYYSKYYRILITTPVCAPTERFDPVSQKCVSICGCGLVNHKLPFCLYFDPNQLSTFVHRYINYTVPDNNPTIPQLFTRFDYYRYHQLLLFNYYGGSSGAYVALALNIQHVSSNYSTPAPNGTDVPQISVALLDGTLVNDTTNIILSDVVSSWTRTCTRTTDGYLFGSVPLKISVSFDKPISSLGTHTLSINAILFSNDIALSNQLQSYRDQMMVSITVVPGNTPDKPTGDDGSVPLPASSIIIGSVIGGVVFLTVICVLCIGITYAVVAKKRNKATNKNETSRNEFVMQIVNSNVEEHYNAESDHEAKVLVAE